MRHGYVACQVSSAADLAFGQPLVHGSAGKPDESLAQFYVRQPAHEKIVHRADRDAQAHGKLPFVFVVRRGCLARARKNFRLFNHALFLPRVRDVRGKGETLRHEYRLIETKTDRLESE